MCIPLNGLHVASYYLQQWLSYKFNHPQNTKSMMVEIK